MKSVALLGFSLALIYAAAPAGAADVQAGQRLTQQWCANCHLVGNANRGSDAVPTLPTIAQRHGQDRQWLRGWLTSPHPPMPNFNLSRQEIDDISAYLAGLPQH
jgi:cytochrome c